MDDESSFTNIKLSSNDISKEAVVVAAAAAATTEEGAAAAAGAAVIEVVDDDDDESSAFFDIAGGLVEAVAEVEDAAVPSISVSLAEEGAAPSSSLHSIILFYNN
jgi:hypothetical protein